MNKGTWNKKRQLLLQRAKLCMEHISGSENKIREIDEALIAEDNRHRIAVQNFKARRKSWRRMLSFNNTKELNS